MNGLPAKIAGGKEMHMTTPPQADGTVNPHILYAASLAGIDTIYKIGGAQAVAAFAYGTETVQAVDKIVGPGNMLDRKSTRLNSSHVAISYAVFCLKKKRTIY